MWGLYPLRGKLLVAGLCVQNAQTASVSHPVAYTMGNGVLFRGVRRPGREVNRG